MTSKTWTGKDAGVRKPMTGETQLSPAEVGVGLREGAFAKGGRSPNYGLVAEALKAMLEKAGQDGEDQKVLQSSIPGGSRQSVNCALMRMMRAGKLVRRAHGNTIRWWVGTADIAKVDAQWAAVIEAKKQAKRERERLNGRNGSDRIRRRNGQLTMAEYREQQRIKREAREAERQSKRAAKQEAQAKRQAGAAVRQERAEARKLAADIEALEAKEAAAKSTKRHVKAMKKATQNINRVADKYRGVNAPSVVPMPQARPKATPIVIPEHLIQRCPPMTLPHERIQVERSRIGQYDTAPGHLAVAMGVAA